MAQDILKLAKDDVSSPRKSESRMRSPNSKCDEKIPHSGKASLILKHRNSNDHEFTMSFDKGSNRFKNHSLTSKSRYASPVQDNSNIIDHELLLANTTSP